MALSTIGRNQLNTGIDDNSDATAITIDSSERVGVGTTSPSTKIHLNESGSANAVQRVQAGTNGYAAQVHLYGNNVGGSAYNSIKSFVNGDSTPQWEITGAEASAEDQMLFHTGGSEKVRIDSSGNVGFGTNSPSYRVHSVAGSGSGIAGFFHNTAGSGNATALIAKGGANNTGATFQVQDYNGNADFTVSGQGLVTASGIVDATAFTGDYGTAFGLLDSTSIGDSNIPYNSFGTPNSTYYRWVLPKAGTYLLSCNLRIRLWGVNGFIKARLYNNTTSTAISGGNISGTSAGGQCNIRMLFENAGNNGAQQFNVNITANYILTTTADNQDIHHQLNSNNNSANSSLQSDTNGRNIHWWQRIG